MRIKKVAGPNQTKTCPRCGRELPLESYCKGNGMYGKRSICKECDHELHNTDEQRERRRLRREQRRKFEDGYIEREKSANLRRITSNEESYKKYLLRGAKQRALRQEVTFDITLSDINIPEYCPLLNIKLVKHVGNKLAGTDNSPSIDKIIPELGYVRGNVWVISNRANRLKNDATLEELRLLVRNLNKKLDSLI